MSAEVNQYMAGTVVRCYGEFIDLDTGRRITPDRVWFVVKPPHGQEAAYEFGVDRQVQVLPDRRFYVDVHADEPGRWWVGWQGEGNGAATREWQFEVQRSVLSRKRGRQSDGTGSEQR